MATKKVIYFIAGSVPDATELADIAKLNAATVAQYAVTVFTKLQSPNFGAGPAEADYVASKDGVAIPDDYSEVDVIDPDAIPNQALTATQAIIEDDVAIEVPVTGSYTDTITPTIVAGVITGFVLS